MENQVIKKLASESTVKDDLQVLYEAVQELGYTEYTVLKILERLSTQLDEIRKATQDQSYKIQYARERGQEDHDRGHAEHTTLQTTLDDLSTQIESTLEELKDKITGSQADSCSIIMKNAAILVQASKQVLLQNGFDPETGVQKSEIDRDWKRFKERGRDFLITLFLTALAGLALREYGAYQREQNQLSQQQIVEVIKELKTTVQESKQASQK